MSSFKRENKQTRYNVLSHRIDLTHNYKLTIKIDQNGCSDEHIYYEIKRQKTIEQELGFKFIRIDPDNKDFDIFTAINELFGHIKLSIKNFIKQNFNKTITIRA